MKLTRKKVNYIIKITNAFEKLIAEVKLEPNKWYHVGAQGWVKKTKDGTLIEGIQVFIDGEGGFVGKKKWWGFWKY